MALKGSNRRKSVIGLKVARSNHNVPAEQLRTLERLAGGFEDGLVEIRCASYCGPGTAGDRGAYVVSHNGQIEYIVEKNGSWSR